MKSMKYPVVVYIFLGLFLVASILQLIFAFTENQKFRRREKILCMLMLGIAAIFALPNEPLIYVGAFLGMIGDLLVLRKKTFIGGVVAFFLGHICYIVETLWRIIGFENLKPMNYVVIALTYLVVAFVMYSLCKKSKSHTKLDSIGQSLYFAILVAYIPVYVTAVAKVGSFMFLSLIGAVIFIASDSILVKTHFGKKFKRYDFYIMLTYLVAEFLLISGMALTIMK